MSFSIGGLGASPFATASAYSGATAAADPSALGRNSGASDAVSDFNAYANETPAQRMRDAILKSMGISEEDLKSMDPKKRQAIEETIREKIKQAAENAVKQGKTGLVADMKA